MAGVRGVRDHLRREIAHGSELLGADPLRPAQPPSGEDRRAPGDAPYSLWRYDPLTMATLTMASLTMAALTMATLTMATLTATPLFMTVTILTMLVALLTVTILSPC